MALQKQYIFHGITFSSAYHRITQIYNDVDRNVTKVTVRVYKDEQSRIDNPDVSIEDKTYFIIKSNDDLKVDDFLNQPGVVDIREKSYNRLKNVENYYSDAIDV